MYRNVKDINISIYTMIYEYIKRLLWKIVLCIKEMDLVIMFFVTASI